MKKLSYEINQKTYNMLCGLAYRIADNKYMIERYGTKETEMEREESHKTITLIFDELDKNNVPFWVQNTVINFADDWRRYKETTLATWLKNHKAYDFKVTATVL